jgi:uncharacterized protein YcbX
VDVTDDGTFRVTRLSVTPVKGLQLHHPDHVDLTRRGVPGDRQFHLVDDQGRTQSCTRNRALYALDSAYDEATGVLTITRGGEVLREGPVDPATPVEVDLFGMRTVTSDAVADAGWSAFFSDLLGKQVQFLRAREPAYDVEPVTLLGASSVAELERRSGATVDARRFRMLIDFEGGDAHVEDTWEGRLLRVGDALLRGGGPVQRCAATTRNPDTGAIDLQTIRLIADYRGRQESVFGLGSNFGVYAEVVEPGTVRVGDTISPGG